MINKKGKEEIESLSEGTLKKREIGRSNTKLILFGGKGGVGKSTNASATALYLSNLGKKVLLVSSDLAPSLSDIFEKEVGGKLTEIKENLCAMEIDASQAMGSFKDKYGDVILDIIPIITPIEKDVLDDMLDEVTPGFDELFAMNEVMDFMTEDYDVIVWDTAPTGHTLRLLYLLTTINSFATGGIKLYSRMAGALNTIKTCFGRDTSKGLALDALRELKESAEGIKDILSDVNRTEFVPIVIPEALALYQTERLKAFLNERGIEIRRIIINNVIPKSECKICNSRRKMQKRYIDELYKVYGGDKEIIEVPLLPEEVKGLEAVSRYADILYGAK